MATVDSLTEIRIPVTEERNHEFRPSGYFWSPSGRPGHRPKDGSESADSAGESERRASPRASSGAVGLAAPDRRAGPACAQGGSTSGEASGRAAAPGRRPPGAGSPPAGVLFAERGSLQDWSGVRSRAPASL